MNNQDILLKIENDIMKKIADGYKEIRCVWVRKTCDVHMPAATFYRKFKTVVEQLQAEGVLRHSYNGIYLVAAHWDVL